MTGVSTGAGVEDASSPAAERGCALVTAASRGIGAAIAKGLAADGWAVGVNYRTQSAAADAVVADIRAEGGEALAIRADVSDPAAADEICTELEGSLGRPILVLVNNAATSVPGFLLQLDDESWGTVIETNLSAARRLTRRVLRAMLRERFGRIVNVASTAASQPTPGHFAYAASKAGLIGLTRAVAVEVASRPVTVNAIAPGMIDTDSLSEIGHALLPAVPARRLGTPEEVAACARFLVSEGAGYVTGTVLTVDGGLTVGPGMTGAS